MRLRLTLSSLDRRLNTDVMVECDPTETVGRVLDAITQQIGISGTPTAEGELLDRLGTVAESPLHQGTTLHYDRPTDHSSTTDGPVLRVVSGPDAGKSRSLRPGQRLAIGRGPGNDLQLADPEVSGRHAELIVEADHMEIHDLDSANHTFVDDRRVVKERLGSNFRFIHPGSTETTGERMMSGRGSATMTPVRPMLALCRV